jgi:hypothetical protein
MIDVVVALIFLSKISGSGAPIVESTIRFLILKIQEVRNNIYYSCKLNTTSKIIFYGI